MEGKDSGIGGTIVYFSCTDCSIEAARASENGGRVLREKMAIGEYGFIALVYDTEGESFWASFDAVRSSVAMTSGIHLTADEAGAWGAVLTVETQAPSVGSMVRLALSITTIRNVGIKSRHETNP